MKAVIGISNWDKTQKELHTLAQTLDSGSSMLEADYHLNFYDAAQLFSELTPARLELLDMLKIIGPVSIYALAQKAGRNYSNIHTDIGKLLAHNLVIKNKEGKVYVPWDDVEIHLALGERAA